MGLQQLLNLGLQSLNHNQTQLQTIGHNIANASVEGFSRQEVITVTNVPVQSGIGTLGTGVLVQGIRRVIDKFLNAQIGTAKSDLGFLNALSQGISLAETFLNESTEGGRLSSALNDFFLAAEDLSLQPEGAAERTALLNAAQILARQFNTVSRSMDELRVDANNQMNRAIDEVNNFAARIAELNARISVSESGVQAANDLRDERQRLVEQISERIDVISSEQSDGQISVFVGRGFPLVQEGVALTLNGVPDFDNLIATAPPVALGQIHFIDLAGTSTNMTSRVSGGELGGLLQLRDGTLANFQDRLDDLAATLIREVNLIHAQGIGLDGSTNVNFFNPLTLTVEAAANNSRDSLTNLDNIRAVESTSLIFDTTVLTGANYKIEFTSSNTFFVQDADTGVRLDETKVSINGGAFGTDTTVTEFTYTGPQTTMEFEGVRVVIQNAAGAPVVGDAFSVSTRSGAARTLALNSLVANDLNKVAAATTTAPGDNTNALALANLRGQQVAQRDSSTLNDFLTSIIVTFGTEGRDIRSRENVAEDFAQTLSENREGISGVSIDEELANVIRFQQNFGATARLMSITTDLLLQLVEII